MEFSRRTFLKGTVLAMDAQGRTLNRCEGIAFAGVALTPANFIKTQAV
jgi:hypothetical protein